MFGWWLFDCMFDTKLTHSSSVARADVCAARFFFRFCCGGVVGGYAVWVGGWAAVGLLGLG